MLKRPADDISVMPVKKARINPKLEAMRNVLDNLLKSADTHHEEARIAAIDAASVLEEEWTDATIEKDNLTAEFEGLESECFTATAYLERYEESDTVKMLKKAADDSKVETLVEDNEKITDTLTKLRNLETRLIDQCKETETQLEEKTKQCASLKERLKIAEQRVETIISFV
jgi:chromosome segregation ATPase